MPLGSLLSGWVTEPFGRKRSFIFTLVPHLIAWMLLYKSTTFGHVLWAQVLIGFGHGLMEAPLITYIGEIVYVEIVATLPTNKRKKKKAINDNILFIVNHRSEEF